jgi:diguanylate cyclase (GGDEF)-like protein
VSSVVDQKQPPPAGSPDTLTQATLHRVRVVSGIALFVLAVSVVVAVVRAPSDGLVIVQLVATAILAIGLLATAVLQRARGEEAGARDAGLTRMLQGLSRSSSSEAIVQAAVDELRRTADADHIVISRLRPVDRVVETTLVSSRARIPPSRSMMPANVLDPARIRRSRRDTAASDLPAEQLLADELARRVADTYGLQLTLAAPLIADGRVVGALILSRRAQREWTNEDWQLLDWSARELSSALARAYALEEAENRANVDALTGLPNRRYLEELLASVGPHRRAADALGVVMIDLDHFKQLNDRYGHAAGDRVLRAVGQRIATTVRADDTAARYGGEEFAVVLRRATAGQAVEVAERLRQAIGELTADELGVAETISASLGVAVASPRTEPSAVLQAADEALYRAKREGRNRVVFK